jgi:aspartyl-tRNA(Asn)/glutamyl-tRNA(Gln) amidotransferase subunit B
MPWITVAGLEIHARLMTETKLFCGCAPRFGDAPNTAVCPVCLGYPGALPVLNAAAVDLALRAATALGATVARRSRFDRKNYIYPDLPKGDQITQNDIPLATGGTVTAGGRTVRIRRLHLEEDAGKLLHEGTGTSLIDLNRAGTPLIEIVSEPDLRSAEEAVAYAAAVRRTLVHAGVCDGNMEEGSLRFDVNVSVHREGEALGTRAEIKNLNSFRFLARAIEFERERQSATLAAGGRIAQETRLFDPKRGETYPMRSKEEAHDYRYFPEPDLLPLEVTEEQLAAVRRGMPELPEARAARWERDWRIPSGDADSLVASPAVAAYFEAVAGAVADPRAAANWMKNDVLGALHERGIAIEAWALTPPMLASLIRLVDEGTISGKAAKDVFASMLDRPEEPERIVERLGLRQMTDRDSIATLARAAVDAHPAEVERYRSGRKQLLGFFVGAVIKASGGRAKPEIVNEVLLELLD